MLAANGLYQIFIYLLQLICVKYRAPHPRKKIIIIIIIYDVYCSIKIALKFPSNTNFLFSINSKFDCQVKIIITLHSLCRQFWFCVRTSSFNDLTTSTYKNAKILSASTYKVENEVFTNLIHTRFTAQFINKIK